VLPRTNGDGSHRQQGFAQGKWAQWRDEGRDSPALAAVQLPMKGYRLRASRLIA
jgi:hypothetical protein